MNIPVDQTRTPRERILDTAAALFLRDGFRAVGIDTIIAQSGVAKMTLYRHFPSKDALIAAYLERSNAIFWQWLEQALNQGATPRDQLNAVFMQLYMFTSQPSCYGCTFQAAAAEFPDYYHPNHEAARAHKQMLIERFAIISTQAGARDPQVLAEQLLLLLDGALVAARVFGTSNPARHVAAAAQALIDAQLSR